MDPVQSAGLQANAGAAQGAAGLGGQSEFDRLLTSMAQGVMSVVMEEMQQMASSDDE